MLCERSQDGWREWPADVVAGKANVCYWQHVGFSVVVTYANVRRDMKVCSVFASMSLQQVIDFLEKRGASAVLTFDNAGVSGPCSVRVTSM